MILYINAIFKRVGLLQNLAVKSFHCKPKGVSLTYKFLQKFYEGEHMKKQIMSIAAIAALFTTGAMAFDSKQDGTIATQTASGLVDAIYTDGQAAGGDLVPSVSQRGDALIYPAFNQKDGWGTEIVVRNTSNKAVVAKAVLYASDDSREIIDFNIYLSAKDVCRFTIKDGKITSTDGSIRTYGIFPHQVDLTETSRDLTDYAKIAFADTKPLDTSVANPGLVIPDAGYVAIFGMEQSEDFNGFHTAERSHKDLYAAFAASLDKERGADWRQLTNSNGAMVNGMFVAGAIKAPNVAADGSNTPVISLESNGTLTTTNVDFTDVDPVLTGTVRIYNDGGRDVLLPATALKNFTDNARVLWTEGEYASIADRRIALGKYVENDIKTDANSAFTSINTPLAPGLGAAEGSTVTYTYANAAGGTTDNSLLITQPYKRILSQLTAAKPDGYTVGVTDGNATTIATGKTFAFQITASPFDEDEDGFQAAPDEIGGTIITSPRTSDDVTITPESYNNELQEIKPTDLEKDSRFGGKFDTLNGIVEVKVPVASIVTQMSASKAGTSDEINWVYSDKITNN